MTYQEKARELVEKMMLSHSIHFDDAKQCALICVDEILSILKELDSNLITYQVKWQRIYLEEVKQQIELLKQ